MRPVTISANQTKVEPRLYIFPHTGGSAEFYVPFARAFAAVRNAWRSSPRGNAPARTCRYTSISELADKLCAMLKPADAPAGQVAFFGHGLGALLAFEVALRFEQAGNPIAALFVSASPPHRGGCSTARRSQGSDRELLSMVSDVTGVKPGVSRRRAVRRHLVADSARTEGIASYDCSPEALCSRAGIDDSITGIAVPFPSSCL